MIPTLLGITVIVFAIINLAPGSPVEQKSNNFVLDKWATVEAELLMPVILKTMLSLKKWLRPQKTIWFR